jgi:ribosomal protein S18 acetylase RimI-like enzyme
VSLTERASRNLGRYVGAIAGPSGATAQFALGIAVAGTLPVVSGYVTAAVPTVDRPHGQRFLDDLATFFGDRNRGYVLWTPRTYSDLNAAAQRRGGIPNDVDAPAMVAQGLLDSPTGVAVRLVEDVDDQAAFGDVAERGYGLPGFALLLERHRAYAGHGTCWFIAYVDGVPAGVATGFLNEETGGIYNVATVEEFRGRGVGAAVTAAAHNALIANGATEVVLQSSPAGVTMYERLGYSTFDLYARYTFAAPAT